MKTIIISIITFLIYDLIPAQSRQLSSIQHTLNHTTKLAITKYPIIKDVESTKQTKPIAYSKSLINVLNKIHDLKLNNIQPPNTNSKWGQSHDTIFVGIIPHDTLRITGNWTHKGPILVFNDGVLIFKHATVIDSGDVYIFQHGQLLADSSSFKFPQQYFYQRGLTAIQNASVNIQHSSFNYSGLSHNLVIGGSANVTMNHIHQNDWTTCGLFGKPTLNINDCNLAGEYILSDSSSTTFTKTDTILLWHHFPDTALVNFTFPKGDTVYNYHFNRNISGVKGIEYSVNADSCHNIMWAMMPVNGSNITISNSKIRAIGAWFQHNDTVNVSKLFDNTSYINFTAPLIDRNLHLINSDVQTWSLYVFDKSHINIDSVQVGEIGTQNRSSVTSTMPFILDGSGGYYWATDTSAVFSFGASAYSYVRSEKNGIFILAYGWVPFSAPQAIGKSIMISTQSNTAGDPIASEAATTWLNKIDGPDSTYLNMQTPITGSAWIDWGPNGNGWMNFANYSMYYKQQGSSMWTPILKDSINEIRHSTLVNWNTNGLSAGNYLLKLTVKNNFNDSIDAIKPIKLLAGITGINSLVKEELIKVYPNPNNGLFTLQCNQCEHTTIEIYNSIGQSILTQSLQDITTPFNLSAFSSGIYQIRISNSSTLMYQSRIIKY